MTLWDNARMMVRDGEPNAALDVIDTFLKGQLGGNQAKKAERLRDEVIMHRASNRRIHNRLRLGLLTNSDSEAEYARRDHSILALIAESELMDGFSPPSISVKLTKDVLNEKLMAAESQLRSTGWLAAGLKLATAVCRLTDGRAYGTGFRCLTNALITNNHVISDHQAAKNFRADFFFEEDALGRLQAPVSASLDPGQLFWTSATLDVTLVGLSEFDGRDSAIIPLSAATRIQVGDHVSIIQHPRGGPKQIAVTNNRILNFYNDFVHYLTDTLPGSSGSPVFTDTWDLVAVHHAGGDVQKNDRGELIFANEGVLITALFKDPNFRELVKYG